MKKILFFLSIIFISGNIFSQADTLYFQKNKKIACKIAEINESEIKYKLAANLDGPLYVVDKSTVIKYTLANGFTEMLVQDELSIENEHKEILGNRRVIKISPFSPAFNHVSFSYESVIKVGMNLDVEAGYINSEINPNYKLYGSSNLTSSGFYIKPGVKFFLGQDFSVKGLKYAHPLKGRYIKLDLAFSYVNYQGLSLMYNNPYYTPSSITLQTSINTMAYGGFVNYGRQFILGNILTLEYYAGIGFTGQSYSYSNPNYTVNPYPATSNYYYVVPNVARESEVASNYYGFLRVPNFGLSFTAGFRIGYIIPNRSQKSNKPIQK